METEIEDTEIARLLESIFTEYGYDFRHYAYAHIKRRIQNRMSVSGLKSFDNFFDRILLDKSFAFQLLSDMSITVTEMFRDPEFYKALREKVIPVLKTYSYIRIWHAGCATGEEVYSMAVLLMEEGLYERSTIYATDFNQSALDRAKEGIFSNEKIKEYTSNYQQSGGTAAFSDYYTSGYHHSIMSKALKKNVVWGNHNLVTDAIFSEVHLILCRNVMIYFDRDLQNRVHDLFLNSLVKGGILCLGTKESIQFCDCAPAYSVIDGKNRIFKKKVNYESFH